MPFVGVGVGGLGRNYLGSPLLMFPLSFLLCVYSSHLRVVCLVLGLFWGYLGVCLVRVFGCLFGGLFFGCVG